eukprot:3706062-Prymnesium_polylepis.1
MVQHAWDAHLRLADAHPCRLDVIMLLQDVEDKAVRDRFDERLWRALHVRARQLEDRHIVHRIGEEIRSTGSRQVGAQFDVD